MKDKSKKRRYKPDLATQIFIGFFLGIGLGVFFGEKMGMIKFIGDGFIMLLQMTVLPYISISLISGLGRLNLRQAGLIARKAGLVLLTLWVIAFIMILLIPFTFPDWQTANFFSTSLVAPPEKINFLELYIPANPFHALASNVVPATVLFSVAMGIGLMGVNKKEGLLNGLTAIVKALTTITNFIVKMAPIGVFGIAASAAGTIDIEGLDKLQLYLYSYMAISLVTAFLIIPKLVTSFTPLSYNDVIGRNKDLLITAFATANLFVVLSMLIAKSIDALVENGLDKESAQSNVDVIVPVSFNFPSTGKLFPLAFALFAAWFVGTTLSFSEYTQFVVIGFFSFFGHPVPALQSLLESFRLPSDTIELYLISDIVTSRFGTLLASVHTLAIAMLGTMAMNKMIKINLKNLLKFLIPSITVTALVVIGLRIGFGMISYEYIQYEKFIHMEHFMPQADAKVYPDWTPQPLPDNKELSRIDNIKTRGFIRIGYFKDALPFVFMNEYEHLVGFDVELAHSLARELGVGLEMVKIKRDQAIDLLNNGYIDMVMSGELLTISSEVIYSAPYFYQTFAFIVEDHRKDEFSTLKAVYEHDSLRVGILDYPYYVEKLKSFLPDAKIIKLNSPRDYFVDKGTNMDAMIYTAEAGSAWSMVYPDYSVTVPTDRTGEVPVCYGLPKGDVEFNNFINRWILLKVTDKTIDRITDYWIYGQSDELKSPRWCIASDVLGWY
jgi:Na+/H+-dicarboxylate symporter